MIVILDNSSLAKLCLFRLAENVSNGSCTRRASSRASPQMIILFIDAECQSQLYLSTIFDLTVKRYKYR